MRDRASHLSAYLWVAFSCSCIGALEQLLGEGSAVQLSEESSVWDTAWNLHPPVGTQVCQVF